MRFDLRCGPCFGLCFALRFGLRLCSGALLASLLGACTSTPAVTSLASAGPESRPTDSAAIEAPAAELPIEPLALEGVRGARAVFALSGNPDQVLALLLDFEHADGHRAWAKHYQLLTREPGKVRARWSFQGHMGVNPTADIDFEVARQGEQIVVRFQQVGAVFGLGAFFGEYRIWPLRAGRSVLGERVFIDSGLWIANASAKDLSDGLREDARLLREWAAATPGRK